MADVSVRDARPEDAEHVARVQLSTWRTAYADLLPPEALDLPLEQAAAVWLHAVEAPAPGSRLLVALERDALVGFLASTPAEAEVPDVTEVSALLVEPRWGRRGHGSRLMAAAVDGWRVDGVRTALAWVWESDAATQSFLRAAGWEPDGRARGLDTGLAVQRQVAFHCDVTGGAA